jgi:putative ATPase
LEKPLAERIRPQNLDQILGQEHITGAGKPLRAWLESKKIPSIIFWGPPGVGKTTLAQVLAKELHLPFVHLSAISAGVKEVRECIERSKTEGKLTLFLDEIHRFNKSQQDALLGAVEAGQIVLIGATTENPSFEVNRALLSRCQVLVLKEHSVESLCLLLAHALRDDAILQKLDIEIVEKEVLMLHSGGDGRRLLNLLEMAVDSQNSAQKISITNALIESLVQNRVVAYDKSGEQHYDIISAFIKSMRGSDPNAALYWVARMLAGGEDITFIARRMLIFAAEDIGLVNPNALLLAQTCFQSCSVIGMPEARIILSEVVIYLATSPKSNSAYKAIGKAMELVKTFPDLPVPFHLRNAPSKLMKDLNYGQGYKYPHDFEGNWVAQQYMPDALKDTVIYEPGKNSREKNIT